MEEFKTAAQVEALFSTYGFQTQNGQYFIGFDTQVGEKTNTKMSLSTLLAPPVVAGMEIGAEAGRAMREHAMKYEYSGLLVAFSDEGFACLQLGTKGVMKTTTKAEKLFLDPTMPMIRIRYEDVVDMTMRNYSFAATKTKIITISTRDEMEYRLLVNTVEKQLPYHEAGFAAYMKKFGNGKK